MTFNKLHPFLAKINKRYLLTKPTSTKKTYNISLDIRGSNLLFKPGDSIAILAQNDPTLVQHILNALHATGEESIVDSRSLQPLSLRSFLTHKANLARLTSSFLKLFYEYETSHDKKNQLHRLLIPENKPLLSQFLTTHDPLDLFKEYTPQTPLQELCNQFGPLLPRFYSIASSQLTSPSQIDLTVALFTFSHSEEKRFGVASHFLCHLAQEEETPVPLYLQPSHAFSLPNDTALPLIMIGPGTGVAPFRAFLQERVAKKATGPHWLFFGERNQATDYFYQQEWEALVHQGHLILDLAFSRDQEEKIYVQHRMQAQSAKLWDWIQQGAIIYLCGDAHHMAKDVEATLIQIAITQGSLSQEEAKAFFKTLRTQKRYQLDIY